MSDLPNVLAGCLMSAQRLIEENTKLRAELKGKTLDAREQCARWLEAEAANAVLSADEDGAAVATQVCKILHRYAERIRTLNLDREGL